MKKILYRNILWVVCLVVMLIHIPLTIRAEFGVGGIITTVVSGISSHAFRTVLTQNGKLITVGQDVNPSQDVFAITRHNLNGSLDVTFGINGFVSTIIGDRSGACDVILQQDSKIVVAGWSELGGKKSFAIARYTNDGSLDTTFASYGTTTTAMGTIEDIANSVIQQSDGKIVAAGSTKIGANFSSVLVRYNCDGSIDTTFGTNGIVITSIGTISRIYSLYQQADGKILAAGYSNNTSGAFTIIRYFNNGNIDTSFGGSGTGFVTTVLGSTDGAQQIIQQMDGKLVAVGSGLAGLAVARYSANGVLDASFNGTGIVTTKIGDQTWGHGIVQQPNGRLVATGYDYNSGALQYSNALVRYLENGSIDNNFGSSGHVTTLVGSPSIARTILLQPDGKLVVSGDYNYDRGFALTRYLNDGTLDTQDDPPLMTGLDQDHALSGQTLNLIIQGWNLNDVVAVQLRNSDESVNASSQIVDDTQITASFTMSVNPGLYNLYLGKNVVNRTFNGVFTVCEEIPSPVQWQINDLGKAGTPVNGPMGIIIGDVDGDENQELYVANGDNKIYRYDKSSVWFTTELPTASAGFFQDVILTDMDLDGDKEVYGANSFPRTYQYKWSGASWSGNSFAAYGGPLMSAGKAGGWLAELYSSSGSDLMQTRMLNVSLLNRTYAPNGGTILCTASGDANNDQMNEIYTAATDHKLYQTRYWGSAWNLTSTVYESTSDMTSLAIGDLDYNGSNELYGSNSDGNVYQFRWNGLSWNSQTINSGIVINKIIVSDGDNNGSDELYAAGQDGHFYQLTWTGSIWQLRDLGNVGCPLITLAGGDGDSDGKIEVYGVGSIGNVFQVVAEPVPGTATPTITMTSTVTPTATITPTEYPLPHEFTVFCSPNPVRGSTAKLSILTRQPADVHVQIFTTSNQPVLSFDRKYQSRGKYDEEFYVGNLANGVYLALVKTTNADGGKDRLIYKFAVIK